MACESHPDNSYPLRRPAASAPGHGVRQPLTPPGTRVIDGGLSGPYPVGQPLQCAANGAPGTADGTANPYDVGRL